MRWLSRRIPNFMRVDICSLFFYSQENIITLLRIYYIIKIQACQGKFDFFVKYEQKTSKMQKKRVNYCKKSVKMLQLFTLRGVRNMLIGFKVKNFLSFEKEEIFSLEAGKGRNFNERIYNQKNCKT